MYHEVKSLASEKEKKKQPNIEAVSWLLKPLKLEATGGYQNQAVAGGIQKWLPRLKEKLIKQGDLLPSQADILITPLQNYNQLDLIGRKSSIKLVVNNYQALKTSGQQAPEKVNPNKSEKPKQSTAKLDTIKDTDISIQYLKSVGPHRSKLFKRLGIETVDELIHYYPRDWQDRSQVQAINTVKAGQMALICGQVKAKGSFNIKRGLNLTKVILEDQSGHIDMTWFNQPYIKDRFEVGQIVVAYGKVEFYRSWQIAHPECEVLEDQDQEQLHVGRIVPIYGLTEKLTQRVIRQLIHAVFKALPHNEIHVLPNSITKELKLLTQDQALRQIHFPDNQKLLEQARLYLIYEELILQQIAISRLRKNYQSKISRPMTITGPILKSFLDLLPFQLTNAQVKAKEVLLNNLKQTRPMHRLLQGDVGSGKTILAIIAALTAIDTGFQAAFMAPTEILAFQHFQSIKKFIEPLGIKLALLTASVKTKEKKEIYQRLRDGDIQIVIGTHALTQEHVLFDELGVVIIDEQHRFGVEQRQLLQAKGKHPHVLVMTATPIPRTLALTVYGDLDVTIIDELPPGRQPITSKWLPSKKASLAYQAITAAVKSGRQAYVVFPLIEESEKLDLKALTIEFERLTKFVFPDFKMGLLHGRLSGQEKESVMNAFKLGEVQILASTTVVEVGVDVSNATIMVIEDADRFGLAALHQLRGRVGRGQFPSSCYLIADPKTDEAKYRMSIMEKVKDGFQLSEKDLALRGPGEFFGLRQHGMPDLKLANLIQDADKIEHARSIAQKIIVDDPDLDKSEHANLKQAYFKIYMHKEKHGQTG